MRILIPAATARVILRITVCAQNLLLAALNFLLFGGTSSEVPRTILVLRTAALGDFILTIPALSALRGRFPAARIVLLTAPTTDKSVAAKVTGYAGAANTPPWLSLAGPGLIDEAFAWSGHSLREVLAQVRPVARRVAPDATFVLSETGTPLLSLARKLLFLRLAGIRGPVYGWRMRTTLSMRFLGEAIREKLEHHVMGPMRSVAQHPGVGTAEGLSVSFPIEISDAATAWARSLWNVNQWHDKRIVAVAPGSIQPHKQWPIDNFLSVCKKLCESADIRILILGTRNNVSEGERLTAALAPRAVSLMGQTSIEQSAALLKSCALAVGNDGGAMHLAAAVGCKVVSIIPGIEYEGAVEPWGNAHLAVRNPVACSPCYSFKHCPEGHRRCMLDLPVARVLEKCELALGAMQC